MSPAPSRPGEAPLILARDVGVRHCRQFRRSLWYGLQDVYGEFFGKAPPEELREGEFWALRHVSFSLRRGEILGIVGRNGSGKTTLLKTLAGLFAPDEGQVETGGRISSLIQLGPGFQRILSGRENIFLLGGYLGMGRREVRERLDGIVDFAGIGESLDAPLGNYSSGMLLRLAFSVCLHSEPDVFIMDEILAVGDVGFRDKCLKALKEASARTAVVMVSHSLEQITEFCTRAMVLEGGLCVHEAADASGAVRFFREICARTA